MKNTLNFNWLQFDQDIKLLKDKISFEPHYIISISRGGNVAGTCLSYMFKKPLKVYNPKTDDLCSLGISWEHDSVLFVDDINDTGATFLELEKRIIKCLKGDYRPGWENIFSLDNVKYAAILNNKASKFTKLNYWVQEIDKSVTPDLWCNFPWEYEVGLDIYNR